MSKRPDKRTPRFPRDRTPSAEETALWKQSVRDIAPYQPDDAPMPEAPAPFVPPEKPLPATAVKKRSAPRPPATPQLNDTTVMHRAKAQRLKRGQLPVDVVVDLHGNNRHTAMSKVERAILACESGGGRVVLVITGKGRGGAPGVLQSLLPGWLELPSLRGKVLALQHAAPAHGGNGAVYILLKRPR